MEPPLPIALLLPLFLLLLLVPLALLARRHGGRRTPPLRLLVVAGSGGHTTEILRLLSCLSESYSPRHYIFADSDNMSEAKIRSFEQKRSKTFSNSQFTLNRIPRSREVRQSWTSSVITTLYSILHSLRLTYKLKPDLANLPTLKPGLQAIKPFGWVVVIPIILAYLKFKLKTKDTHLPHSRKLYRDRIQSSFSGVDGLCNRVLCNGPGTCVPVCISALLLGLLGIKRAIIVYVESICRVETLSLSGKILYYFSDYFIVQWPDLKEKYPKSVYLGRIV